MTCPGCRRPIFWAIQAVVRDGEVVEAREGLIHEHNGDRRCSVPTNERLSR